MFTADYGQKVRIYYEITLITLFKAVPCKHYEDQLSYFGKRGMSWHFLHFVAKISGVFVQHSFIHVMKNDNTQVRKCNN